MNKTIEFNLNKFSCVPHKNGFTVGEAILAIVVPTGQLSNQLLQNLLDFAKLPDH